VGFWLRTTLHLSIGVVLSGRIGQMPYRASIFAAVPAIRFWLPVPLGWHRDVRSVVTVKRNGMLWRSRVSPAVPRGSRTGAVGYDRY
jgi:hypothetical protein